MIEEERERLIASHLDQIALLAEQPGVRNSEYCPFTKLIHFVRTQILCHLQKIRGVLPVTLLIAKLIHFVDEAKLFVFILVALGV